MIFYAGFIGWIAGTAYMGQTYSWLGYLSGINSIFILFLLLVQWYGYHRLHHYVLKSMCLILACSGSAILGLNYADQQLQQRLALREKNNAYVEVLVYINTLSHLTPKGIQQKVTVLNRYPDTVQWLIQPQLTSRFELGRYYRLTGWVQPVHGYANLASFDLEKWYLQQNIMATFKLDRMAVLTASELTQSIGDLQYMNQTIWQRSLLWIEKQRLAMRTFIQQQPIQHQGLSLALLTGDRSLLSGQVIQQFQRLGIQHLLVISGPHVLLFAWWLCSLLQRLIAYCNSSIYLTIPRPYLFAGPFLSGVFYYSAYVGFDIPVMRTLLMSIVISFFLLCKQALSPLKVLLSSAFILLLYDPFSVLSAAFWLSYGACLILLRLYQAIRYLPANTLTWQKKISHYLWILIESQLRIFLALLPLMIIFFQHIVWISPLSNVIAIPFISFIVVPLDIIAGITYFIFAPLSAFLFQLNDVMLSLLMSIMTLFDQWFKPQPYVISYHGWFLASLMLSSICCAIPYGVIPVTWPMICLTPLLFGQNMPQPFQFVVLDVGQGQAIFLRHQSYSMMIDTGGHYREDEFSIGQQVILPFLSAQYARNLDILVFSHFDQDHSGAYFKIKDQLQVKQLYANQIIHDIPSIQLCYAGQKFKLGEDVSIEILSPWPKDLPKVETNKNEYSCVVYLSIKDAYPYQHYLIMGDAGWQTEFNLVQHYAHLPVDVLVLGHHGSRYSSAYAFLKHFQPKLAIISAGLNNPYHHPNIATLRRLEQLKIPYLLTAQAGSIKIERNSTGITELKCYRQQFKWLN